MSELVPAYGLQGELTRYGANKILREAVPGANARRTMCGSCGQWSPWFLSDDIADTPPGWLAASEPYAWAKPSTCPECVLARVTQKEMQ